MDKEREHIIADKTMLRVARVTSMVFTPFSIPFLSFLVLFLFSYLRIMPIQYKLIVLGIVYCFTILTPTITIFLFRKINGFARQELSERKKRYVPILLTIISYVFCLLMMRKLNIPWYMTGIILASLVVSVICIAVNLKWKLSEHMAGIGSLVCVSVISVLFVIDTAESVKAALDLAKVLDAMTAMRAELDDIQVQMALLKADTRQRVEEAKEVSALKLELAKAEAAARTAAIKQETAAKAAAMKQETAEKAALLCVEAAERMESLTDSAAGRMSRLANSTADRMNSLADSTAERISSLADSTAGRVGTLVEHTADKVTKTAGRLSELTEDAAAKVSSALKYTASSSDSHEGKESFSHIRRERLAALSQRLDEMKEKQHSLSARIGFYHRSLLKGNPSASCPRFAEALKELREIIADTKH